jgi:hypothetical protein
MTDKPDMCAALRKWAYRLRGENNSLAESLAGYADAWEAEREERQAGDAEGWIENTGAQPVADEAEVQFRHRVGDETEGLASDVDWDLYGGPYEITHWRLHKPQESKA